MLRVFETPPQKYQIGLENGRKAYMVVHYSPGSGLGKGSGVKGQWLSSFYFVVIVPPYLYDPEIHR